MVEEQLRMEAALLHPKARTDYQETLAQLVLVTSQTPRKLKQQLKVALARQSGQVESSFERHDS